MKIKDLPWFNRPGFKLTRKGPEDLDDAELLSIIFGVGKKGESALELSNRLFKDFNFDGLEKLNVKELVKNGKMDFNKAMVVVCFFELVKRYNKYMKNGFEAKLTDDNHLERKSITCAKDVYDMFVDKLKDHKKEYLFVVLLNTKNEVIGLKEISVGTLNSSLIHPREVFKEAIRESANSIILVHNHPSGDCNPSKEDIEITEKLIEAGKSLDIKVLDHIIIGDKYWSYVEKNN